MIPLIFGAAALGTAVYGTFKGAEGLTTMNQAKRIGQAAQARHESAAAALEIDLAATNQLAEQYGQLQLMVIRETIGRFVRFIEKTGRQAAQSEKQFLQGLDVSIQQVSEYRTAALEAEQFFAGGLKAIAAATAGYGGALSLATSVGVASTGTLISGLSGAAATNATLAWLGGGSLAAGGGGMALGSLVLGGITLGPALAVGGCVFAAQAEKSLTKAQQFEAEVSVAIEKIEAVKAFLIQVNRRLNELQELVKRLNAKASQELIQLESKPFHKRRDAKKFQEVALLIRALAEIMKTPVLDPEGQMNPAAATVYLKYRNL